jgi:epoxyqueuosine reductase
MTSRHNTRNLRENVRKWGASLIGFADLGGIVSNPFDQLPYGVSIGVRLSDRIVDELVTGPTKAYAYHYHVVNRFLDDLSLRATNLLQEWGFNALPIPTSQTVNVEEHKGHLSHKMVATRAGMGWIGKSALLITPEFGPRIRLTTILTSMPLQTGKPVEESLCENCQACVEACPVKAIRGKDWSLTVEREDLLDVDQCAKRVDQEKVALGAPVCGVCVRICPKGKRTL